MGASLATVALWIRIQTSLKNTIGRHKHRGGLHTLARPKNMQKDGWLKREMGG